MFDDPDTSSRVMDEVASITMARRVEAHLGGERDGKESEQSTEGADMDKDSS